jgi:TrmH family RNA methyltransferase
MHAPLASPDNPLVKALLRLHRGRHRAEDGRFLVEGRRAIDGFLAAGWMPEHLLVSTDETAPAHWPADRIRPAAPRVLTRLSQASTPSGLLASFPLPTTPATDPAAGGLCCVGVADPGNLGTLLRTAAAFGIGQVALCGGADPFSHKVVQATAGALAKLRLVLPAGPAALSGGAAPTGGAPLAALVVSGGVTPEALPRRPRWLVVGSEADGLPADWLAACVERVTLPMPGGTESLNAAVAGAIAMYALLRSG